MEKQTKTYLAIETSCDETSIAIVNYNKNENKHNFSVLSHITLSQIEMHRPYGGVYPNVARREHETNIIPVLVESLNKAGLLIENKEKQTEQRIEEIHSICSRVLHRESIAAPHVELFTCNHQKPKIDGIVVTNGPGLAPALWVGVNVANALGEIWQLPVLGVNHMEGHIYSSFATGANFQVPEISFPALSLLLSGGHTELVLMQDWHDYTIIGQTVDDALGEAFDKTARLMGLPYPGGPEIDKLASKYSEFLQTNKKEDLEHYTLPRPLLHSSNYNFSFSGLKTAVRYLIDTLEKPLKEETKQAISHEFQSSVLEVVAKKTKRAIEEFAIATLLLGGGVTANKHIQEMIVEICKESKTELYIPKGVLAMDNALMIAIVGSILFQRNQQVTKEAVLVNGGLTLG